MRKRSTYCHRWPANPGSLQRVINRLEPFNAEELLRLELPIRISYQALCTGSATESDFYDLVAAANATMVRAESVGAECLQIAIDAQAALSSVYARFERLGKWGFAAEEMHAVGFGIELHEQFVRNSTPEQMVRAMREVLRRGEVQREAA